MSWRFTSGAKITGSSHNSETKVAQPHAIDYDPRSERIIFICDRLRQFQSPASFGIRLGVIARDQFEIAPGDLITAVVGIPTLENGGIYRGWQVCHGHGEFGLWRHMCLPIRDVRPKSLHP